MRRQPLFQVWGSARTAAGSGRLRGEYAGTPRIGIHQERRTEHGATEPTRFCYPPRQAKHFVNTPQATTVGA
ncbi:hypothetical protein GCM10009854_46660 [Saccharopolyspora halophila]|uniref:Uncharacterized protein n=1 Tax=Saccharopolyspora halophila TaxID=405551 RepID=A0ABP5TU66_9PSEU